MGKKNFCLVFKYGVLLLCFVYIVIWYLEVGWKFVFSLRERVIVRILYIVILGFCDCYELYWWDFLGVKFFIVYYKKISINYEKDVLC